MEENLLTRIYGATVGSPGHLPYRVFSDGRGESYGLTRVEHWPGSHGQPGEVMPTDCKLWGFVGLTVEDYKRPVQEQPVRICWTGIDIDADDNTHLSFDGMLERVRQSVNHNTIIRTSKSGRGLHVIMPWPKSDPRPYAQAKTEAKHDAAIWVKQLITNGVTPCVFGLVNMWLYSEGGQQRTL